MTQLSKIMKVLESKCIGWDKICGEILGVSNNEVYEGQNFMAPPEISLPDGIFAGNESFYDFIRDDCNNWSKTIDNKDYIDCLYHEDECKETSTYFPSKGFIALQLSCILSYLRESNSNLIIPFFIYGQKENDFASIRGKISKEKIELGHEI